MAGREGTSFSNLARLLLLPAAGLLVLASWWLIRPAAAPPKQPPARPRHVKAAVMPTAIIATREKHAGDIVLILDDVGFDHQPLDAAMALDPNVNFSVLPNAPRGVEFATHLHGHGFEVLCHLPMEPEGFPEISPGRGAVLTSMSNEEIARATESNVSAVPFARGVNNHMGSRATADRRVMRSVLSSLPHGMYFIDSRTSGASVGASVARQMKVPTAARNVFLDDVQTAPSIGIQIAALRHLSEQRGVAVGIGHMYPVTIRALADAIPQLRSAGFRLIRASEAVR